MLNERDRAFFQPKWRRVAITAFCTAWAAFEWYGQNAFWGMIATGAAAYCYWEYIYKFDQDKGV
ncbi:MAG: hypothetical protein WAT29_14520 [Thiolinea sp.]